MNYPDGWNEFVGDSTSFLFYDPNEWGGNFRISAYRDTSPAFAEDCMKKELSERPGSRPVKLAGKWWIFSQDNFLEEGEPYTNYCWLGGLDNTVVAVTFTVKHGSSYELAQQVVASVEVRNNTPSHYPAEVIDVRLSEIYQIDSAYEWVEHEVKERLKLDFQGQESDLHSMQQLIDAGYYTPKQREAWINLGIAYCVILANEVDGWEWHTLMDGNREAPLLINEETGEQIDPMKVAWSKVKAGQKVRLDSL